MAESTDKRTKQIADKRVEKGQEFERYQEAQNQLLAIQAEQQQNLAIQKAQAMNGMEQNQILGQAAEIMNMNDLNPQTQQVLGNYGLRQPRVIKNSDVRRQGPNNITINNTTINNTAGPVQGREISIKPQEASQGRFKAWLTNVFARQDAIFQKQNQDYLRRESSLTRNANKMLRKLDNIGKDIGKALDPRRIANTERNRIKTLAAIIGMPLLIKYLPKLFDSVNNLGEKIKDAFTGENGILSKIKGGMESEDGWFRTALKKIYSSDGNGVLNELLQNIQESLYKRSEFAKKGIEGIPLTKFGERILTWLQLFFGGPDAAMALQNKKIESDFIKELESGDKMSEINDSLRAAKSSMADRKGSNLVLHSDSRFGISSSDGTTLQPDEYKNWLEKTGQKANDRTAKEFLNQKKFAYTGESIILTKRVYDNSKMRVFNPKIDLNDLKQLRRDSNYPDLSTSLEVIHEIRRGYGGGASFRHAMGSAAGAIKKAHVVGAITNIAAGNYAGAAINLGVSEAFKEIRNSVDAPSSTSNMSNLETFLSLLLDKAKTYKILVFPEFITLLASPELEKELEIPKVKVKLIRYRFSEGTQYDYWSGGTKGLSDFYKKIVRVDATFNNNVDATPLVLPEKDFLGRENSREWELRELDGYKLGRILEELTGSSKINYSEATQDNMQKGITENVNTRTAELERHGYSYQGTPNFENTRNKEYENMNRMAGIYRSEKEALKEQKRLEKEAKKTGDWSKEKSEKYIESKKSRIAVGIEDVNYSPDSSTYSRKPTQEDLDSAPRVRSIRNVTQAFGGSGTLTSNFMEYRKDYYYKNGHHRPDGYHYGVDLANDANAPVIFPGNGTVEAIVSNGMMSHVDIRDDNGYLTRYYHTKKYGGVEVGDRVTPGQPIGATQSKSENQGAFGPHIHVEVHDPDWKETDKHGHYENPLVYWNTNKATSIQSAPPEYLKSNGATNQTLGASGTDTTTPPQPKLSLSPSNYFDGTASGEFSGGPSSTTPDIEKRSNSYTPSSTAISKRVMKEAEKSVTYEDKQVLLSALGIIADNTAETAHILRNTDRNVAGIGGAVSKPDPKPNPSTSPIQTKNP